MGYPKQYLSGLSKKDRKRQLKALNLAKKSYKKGVYVSRPHLKSFKSQKSRHVVDFENLYGTKITNLKEVSKKTGVPIGALEKVLNKGRGAYYSSGSRPNQTAASWAYARLGSVLLKRNSYKIDKHILDEYKVSKILPPNKKIKKIKYCCESKNGTKKCTRKSDGKEFDISKRRFTKKRCITKPIRGFTMRSSCAPWKNCKK